MPLHVVQEATTESTMLSLVSADIGFTFITETAKGRKPDNVVLLDVEDLNVSITLMAMWRAADKKSRAARIYHSDAVSEKPARNLKDAGGCSNF